jgi:hypothetical protein
MHQLAITYDKLRKNRAQNRARIRALLDRVFPEFPRILDIDTDTAVYLLRKFLFPDEFLAFDIRTESRAIEKISRRQCGRATLEKLQAAARTTIGIVRQSDERLADCITLDAYLALIDTLELHLHRVLDELIVRAKHLPQYERINSLSGAGPKLTALFLGEVQDLSRFTHYRHLEKLAGLNLRLYDSGRYSGTRHISSIGNNRLRWSRSMRKKKIPLDIEQAVSANTAAVLRTIKREIFCEQNGGTSTNDCLTERQHSFIK